MAINIITIFIWVYLSSNFLIFVFILTFFIHATYNISIFF